MGMLLSSAKRRSHATSAEETMKGRAAGEKNINVLTA